MIRIGLTIHAAFAAILLQSPSVCQQATPTTPTTSATPTPPATTTLPTTPTASTTPTAAGAAVKIVLIHTQPDHPWGTHMYEQECRLLAKCLNQNPGVEAVVSKDRDWPEDPGVLSGAKAIVFYSRPAGDIVLGEAHRTEFEKLMQAGVGYAALHWGTCAQKETLGPDYLEVSGGWFNAAFSHPFIDRQPLVQVDPRHPVSRGWGPWTLHEEFYVGTKIHDRAQRLVTATVEGAEQVVAWSFERQAPWGTGRSFGCTLGHFHDNFTLEPFRKIVVNGILWSAGVEIPTDGANVNADPADLAPPPEPKPGSQPK